jgi:hypothetical protein
MGDGDRRRGRYYSLWGESMIKSVLQINPDGSQEMIEKEFPDNWEDPIPDPDLESSVAERLSTLEAENEALIAALAALTGTEPTP